MCGNPVVQSKTEKSRKREVINRPKSYFIDERTILGGLLNILLVLHLGSLKNYGT